MFLHRFQCKKRFYLVSIALLFLGLLIACFAGNTRASAASAAYSAPATPVATATPTSSVLMLNVQPYQHPFTVYEVGQAMNNVVATGSDSLGPGDPITATIDWGDKTTPTQYTFIDGRTFEVAGAHAYSKVGKYTITVTVAITAFQQSASGTGVITAVPAYTLAVKNIQPALGQAFSGIVATGTDPFPNDTLQGTIDWGDKTTPTSVQVTSSTSGVYQLNATHTYSQVGTWTITVSLTSFIVGPIQGTGTATVVTPAFTLSARNITARAWHRFHGTVATVTGTISRRGLSVTINWGDGTTVTFHLDREKGTLSIKSIHTYKKVGSYPITISIKDNGTGQTETATGTATVA